MLETRNKTYTTTLATITKKKRPTLNLKHKYRTLIIGGIVTVLYLLLTFIGEKTNDGLFILMLYFPGLFFGIGIAIALKKALKEKTGLLLVVCLCISFYLTLMYATKNFEILLEFRSRTLGGFGGLLSLIIIQLNAKLRFKPIDYILGIIIGIIATYKEVLSGLEIYPLFIAIGLWQFGILFIINRRQIIENKTVANTVQN